MSFFGDYSEESRPVTWFGTHPIYVANILVMVHVALMVLTSLVIAAYAGKGIGLGNPILRQLTYNSAEIIGYFKIWQIVTYSYVEPASIGFAVQMFFFYQFGPEVEKALGRKRFLMIYFASPICVGLLLLLMSSVFGGIFRAGPNDVVWGVFIAAATLYPNSQFFVFNITIKVVVWIILAIYTLVCLMLNDWPGLVALWTACAVGYYGVRATGWGGETLWIVEKWNNWKLEREAKKRHMHVVREKAADQSMDAILDKISREGMGSLTPAEKAALERGRANLLKRDKKP
ncbi:MAG: rhomboid family intramembrane serine protease [Candidatus Methylacidiphilales bacterium]|nr:rhomboid family intramembrane serine protease [Candidatus Methylacidiphilales bacterium]